MKQYTVIHDATGRILRNGYCANGDILLQGGPGLTVIEGRYDDSQFYFEGAVATPFPPRPSDLHEFDFATKTWLLNTARLSERVLARRDRLLERSEWTQLPEQDLQNKLAWRRFRALLERIPSQPGFPVTVKWPDVPPVLRSPSTDTVVWTGGALLVEAKEGKWAEMKDARAETEFGGFVWDGSTFDSDQMSQQRIQGAAQLAQLALAAAEPFSMDWTLQNNTSRTLSALDMLNVGKAMGVHINAAHVKARVLRASIEACATRPAVALITWA